MECCTWRQTTYAELTSLPLIPSTITLLTPHCSGWWSSLPLTHAICHLGDAFTKPHAHICPRITTARWKVETTQVFSTASMVLTSLACWALMGSAYCNRAWNWLFFVNVIIFKTVPNLEKICKIIFAHFVTPSPELSIVFTFHIIRSKNNNCPVSL